MAQSELLLGLFVSCVTLDKSLNLSVLWFPHPFNGDNPVPSSEHWWEDEMSPSPHGESRTFCVCLSHVSQYFLRFPGPWAKTWLSEAQIWHTGSLPPGPCVQGTG